MILYVTDRNIRVDNADNQISYNSDYIAEFRFDDEWNGKVKTARFVQNGEYVDVVLVDDRCKIPPLKTGFVRVGVFSDSMTSTYADVYFKTSIKDGTGNPAEPPEDVYAQLTALIESGMLKGEDGLTPYVGENNNWWIGNIDTGILARGTDGYTPVKGVDYFTEGEVQQIQNEVSSGAIGDFKAVVDSETNKFDANAQEKFETYNANADSKFEVYNTNAATKFSGYNSNAESKVAAYNQNDSEKTKSYNQNADNRVAEFNAQTKQIQTDISGLKSDLTGLQTVVDSKANKSDLAKTNLYLDALYKLNKGQTYDVLEQESEAYSVDVPSGAKYVGIDKVGGKSVVWNQLIDTSKAVLDTRVGVTLSRKENGKLFLSGTATGGTAWCVIGVVSLVVGHKYLSSSIGENIPLRIDQTDGNPAMQYKGDLEVQILTQETNGYAYAPIREGVTVNAEIDPFIIDLTQMFGAGNEPSTVEEFEAMFPADYYPYSEPTIISSQIDRVDVRGVNLWDEEWEVGSYGSDGLPLVSTDKIRTKNRINVKPSTAYYFKNGGSGNFIIFWYDDNDTVISYEGTDDAVKTSPANAKYLRFRTNNYGTTYNHDICINLSDPSHDGKYSPYSLKQITTNFPVLNSAGSVYDYIDLNEGKLHQRVGVVDLGTLNWRYSEPDGWHQVVFKNRGRNNLLCDRYKTDKYALLNDKTIGCNSSYLVVVDTSYTDGNALKQALQGVMLYYELAEEVITDIEIPTELTEWLEVEAGGSITFHNTDEGKRLLIPNKLSFVRKLDEVTV